MAGAGTCEIVLVAVNARYTHCAHGVRCLLANLGPLQSRTRLLEYDLGVTPLQLVADVLERRPRVVGFSVYLWNVRLFQDAARILRRVAPAVRIAVGGPEITPEGAPAWRGLADALVCGEGETAFRALAIAWLAPAADAQPAPADGDEPVCVVAAPVATDELVAPDACYTATDLRQRHVYVESARGCPFQCAYCTSSGQALRRLPLPQVFATLEALLSRGVRRFKFLDRSFNAETRHAVAVLDWLRDRRVPGLQLHLEIVPVALDPALWHALEAFPPGTLHLEVGVQTLNPAVGRRIGRPITSDRILDTLHRLVHTVRAEVQVDLIAGLPGEDLASLGQGFDRLVALRPEVLQLNLLKRLPGTPLARTAASDGLLFSPAPPYEVLRTDVLDFDALMQVQRLARCWELFANRARFVRTLPLLWNSPGASAFARVGALAERIQQAEGRLHALALDVLTGHLRECLTADPGRSPAQIDAALAADRLEADGHGGSRPKGKHA